MKPSDTEIPLDEVLSSIKQMVIDEEPPVLDLTDVVGPDGVITKVQSESSPSSDISSFLKLVQENQSITSEHTPSTIEAPQPTSGKEQLISDLIKDLATPLIEKWIADNMQDIVNNIVAIWVHKNLPHVSASVIENSLKKAFNK